MKIYFQGAVRHSWKYREEYNKFINYLKKHGDVLSKPIRSLEETMKSEEGLSNVKKRQDDLDKILACDVFIAELSMPSTTLGIYIEKAENLGKQILCLYNPQEGHPPLHGILGNTNLSINSYNTLNEAFKYIDDFFEDIQPVNKTVKHV